MNSEKNMSINLSFDIMSFYKPRNLDVYLNDKLIYEQQVQTNFSHVNTQTQLNNGTNIIRFYTKDGCKRPYDVPELKNSDKRCLSFVFQKITMI